MKKVLLSVLTLLAISGISIAQNLPSYLPANGLVGWWPFNGNANDESGNGNNGTVNGPVLNQDRFGNPDKAYSFDGVDDWIQVDYDSILNLGNEFTLSVWINSRPGFGSGAPWADHNHIISRGGGGGPGAASYVLLINSTGNIWLGLHDGVQNYGAPSSHLNNPNQWYLVTTTLKNSVVSYYFNGEKYDSATNVQPPQNSNFNLAFGREGNSGPPFSSICHDSS